MRPKWASWEALCKTGRVKYQPYTLFCWRNHRLLGSSRCHALLGLGWGEESECSFSFYHSTVVLLGVCGPDGCFGLTPGFWGFCNGVWSMITCLLVFLWGGLKLETIYVTMLMTSFPLFTFMAISFAEQKFLLLLPSKLSFSFLVTLLLVPYLRNYFLLKVTKIYIVKVL